MDSKLVVAFVALLTISTLPLRTDSQSINRTGCGMSKFCASEPATCDPSMSSSCFFVSSVSNGGQNFSFQLSGSSTGYIALGLSVDAMQGGNDTTYVCANNNNSVQFSSNLLINNTLTLNPASSANLAQGSVNGSSIQCTFSATVPNATATNFFLFIFNGTFTNWTLGSPNAVFQSTSAVNMSVANSNATNGLPATAAPPTTASSPSGTALNITRTGCGTSKFCTSEPATCDPSTSRSCFFVSSVSNGGQTFSFQLSGSSTGYIALGLSVDAIQGGNDTTYVCANNNNSVQFSSNLLNNNTLTLNPASSANLTQGSVNGSFIQCTFSATVPNATARASASTSFFLFIFNGTFINGTLGSPNAVFRSSSAVDVSNSSSMTTNALTATTASPAAGGVGPFHHFLSQALLIVLGVLGLAML